MLDCLLVFTNVPDEACAERIASILVESGLAACVNIMPRVQSIYRWDGKVNRMQEIPVLCKTSRQRYPDVEEAIRMHHPYEVPEIIAIEASAGLPAYLRWIAEMTRSRGHYVA